MPNPPPNNGSLAITSLDLTIPVDTHATGWQVAMHRPPKFEVRQFDLRADVVRSISIPIQQRLPSVRSYYFPELPEPEFAKDRDQAKAAAAKQKPPADRAQRRATRMRPPTDIIKLGDRLYYTLQPPLESLISNGSLKMPFHPFPYQFTGVAFLYPRYAAILADEMGLGKTMQAITAIRLLLHAGEVRQLLLICPKPLVSNWKREFNLWAPELPLTIIEGDQPKREWQWRLPQSPIKIANYELLMRDESLITDRDSKFDLVVLDEAQRIKNRSSATSKVARAIPRNRSWALTGTPVENSPEDLHGIFEFLAPGYLHSEMNLRGLGQAVGDYILRRTKDEVLTDLPPKLFRDAEVDLTPAQRETYDLAEGDGVVRLTEMGHELTVQHVFELVLRLKQICNFDPATDESAKVERIEADLEEIVASGEKAIIFSQWVESLLKLRKRIERFGCAEYHGKIPAKRREGVIDQFKNDPNTHVILMSYGAGSVGLNLQFCRYVFLFDRWWNPAVEDQAINRAHRIGAKGSVTVTRFIATRTIEERINQVLEEKRQLFETIFSEAGAPGRTGMSQDEIFGLFDLHTPKGRLGRAA
jgi:SNF2 family DNA or RNA helicase